MAPAKLQSLLQSAIVHHRAGRLAQAEIIYRQARVAAPRHFEVLQLSGLVAYQQERIVEAIDLLSRAHKIDPRHPVCEMRLALALIAAKRATEAEAHLRHVVQLKPDLHEGWDNLAFCLKTQDRLVEAVGCHEKALALKPDYAIGWYNFGLTQSLLGRVGEALACHERAIAADSNYAMARFGRAQALQQAHRIAEAVAEFDRFLALKPQHVEARSNRLFALNNIEEISRERLFAEHVAFGKSLGSEPAVELVQGAEPARRLRLAILSPDLRTHSCAYFLEPLLQHLDREQFELYLYHDHFREDAVSARLRGFAAVWRNFVGQPNAVVEKTIRADQPDIVIDLAGHVSMACRLPLFAKRLAPVQITYLGYPNTTGLSAMDYRFTDALADPIGEADAFATETLVRFAPTAWAYVPPGNAPEVAPPPCLERGHVTFGCFNHLAKITDRAVALWARLLREVPNSRLRLKGRGLGEAAVRHSYLERFARLGLPTERLDLLERTDDTQSHLALYRGVDLALDTFPYHGTTTTCEALWMGVPVITRAGDRHAARVGVSLLNAAGHPEWIASTDDDYVRIAAELASDPARLAGIRAGLRNDLRRGPLLDHAGQSARFAAALRQGWGEWCARCPQMAEALP